MPDNIVDAINARLAGATPAPLEPPAPLVLVPFTELAKPDLETSGLVKGLIDRNALVLIYGEPGSRKTFLALDLALTTAAARGWFGWKTTRCRVVYIAAEAGKSIRNRVAAWAQTRWDEQQGIDFRALLSPIDLCHLDNPTNIERFVEFKHACGKVDIVVIDTVARAMMGGDENSSADMGALIGTADRLRAELQCTVILIHHVGKDASRGARGHSSLRCAVDTEIEVKIKDKGEQRDISVATVTKQRDGVCGVQFAFRLRQVVLGKDQDGDDVTSCVVDQCDMTMDQAEMAYQVLLEVIGIGGVVSVAAWRAALKKRDGFVKSDKGFRMAFSRAKDELCKDGRIRLSEDELTVELIDDQY